MGTVSTARLHVTLSCEDQAYKIPEGFTFEEAALSEPFAAATHTVCEITRPQPGDVVLLSGPGPIGLMCLKLLAAMGIRTIVAGSGVDQARLECARRIGAARVVNVDSDDVVRSSAAGNWRSRRRPRD